MIEFLEQFFREWAQAWREGWRKAKIRAPGIKVGRGFFSNWFLSERERDIRALRELYNQVHDRFYNSLLANEAHVRALIDHVVIDVFDDDLIPASRHLVDAVHQSAQHLLLSELCSLPEVKDEAWPALRLERMADLRRKLQRRNEQLADWEAYVNRACEKTVIFYRSMLAGASEAPEIEAEGLDTTECIFTTRVIDHLSDPVQIVENICWHIFDEGIAKRGIFESVRSRINTNLLYASGIEPWHQYTTTKSIITPKQARGYSAVELVDTYLHDTPFLDVFDAPIDIALPRSARFEHCQIVGGTGHGKTQLLQSMIYNDLTTNRTAPPGMVVIDSQGDLIRTLLRLPEFDRDDPASIADRLILIDPEDVEYPVALNLFAIDHDRIEQYSPADRERVFNGIIDVFDYVFSALLGSELTQKQGVVFRYLARLMLTIPGATIQTLRELMEHSHKYRPYMEKLDGSAKHFFANEFFSPSFSATKKQIQRRLWGILANPIFERMLSHRDNRIDLFEALNDGKIVLINTAKDLLKSEGSSILGKFFIAKTSQAVLERATIPSDQRRPAFIYVDEAQDYFDETMGELLNQARKYNVGLTLAHQNLDQLSPRLRATVAASTSIKFAGGVSSKDARSLADDMRTGDDFIRSMRKHRDRTEFALFIKNHTRSAIRIDLPLGTVNSLASLHDGAFEALIATNRKRYCSTLQEIDEIIGSATVPEPPAKQKAKAPSKPITPPNTANAAEREPPQANDGTGSADTPTLQSKPKEPTFQDTPAQTEPVLRPPKGDAYLAGQGGREHRRLQEAVRKLAQDRGFKATVEYPVDNGAVDVVLEHEKLSVAVEISVTTSADHERANVEKCIKAGFGHVVLLVPDAKRLRSMRDASEKWERFSYETDFRVYSPDEFLAFLDAEAARLSDREDTSHGYRVRVVHKPLSPTEASHRRAQITEALTRSIQNPSRKK